MSPAPSTPHSSPLAHPSHVSAGRDGTDCRTPCLLAQRPTAPQSPITGVSTTPGAEIWPNPDLGKQPRNPHRLRRADTGRNVNRSRPSPLHGFPRPGNHTPGDAPQHSRPPRQSPAPQSNSSATEVPLRSPWPTGGQLPFPRSCRAGRFCRLRSCTLICAPNAAFSQAPAKLNLSVSRDEASAASHRSRPHRWEGQTQATRGSPALRDRPPEPQEWWRITRQRRRVAATRREPTPEPWARGSPPRSRSKHPEKASGAGGGESLFPPGTCARKRRRRTVRPTHGSHRPERATCRETHSQ